MTPPAGTFLARVRNGAILIPGPLKQYCDEANWTLFRFTATGDDRLAMEPVLASEADADFHASLSPDGRLWIPADLRAKVSLGEQSVMLRIENGAIAMYLRKVFDTLGFRP